MNKKILIGVGGIIVAYVVYAAFFLKTTAVGDPCQESEQCKGQCIKLSHGGGEKLREVCTKTCTSPSDCPAPTKCESLKTMNVSAKGDVTSGAEMYCLRSD
jgi:hypothetical protein